MHHDNSFRLKRLRIEIHLDFSERFKKLVRGQLTVGMNYVADRISSFARDFEHVLCLSPPDLIGGLYELLLDSTEVTIFHLLTTHGEFHLDGAVAGGGLGSVLTHDTDNLTFMLPKYGHSLQERSGSRDLPMRPLEEASVGTSFGPFEVWQQLD